MELTRSTEYTASIVPTVGIGCTASVELESVALQRFWRGRSRRRCRCSTCKRTWNCRWPWATSWNSRCPSRPPPTKSTNTPSASDTPTTTSRPSTSGRDFKRKTHHHHHQKEKRPLKQEKKGTKKCLTKKNRTVFVCRAGPPRLIRVTKLSTFFSSFCLFSSSYFLSLSFLSDFNRRGHLWPNLLNRPVFPDFFLTKISLAIWPCGFPFRNGFFLKSVFGVCDAFFFSLTFFCVTRAECARRDSSVKWKEKWRKTRSNFSVDPAPRPAPPLLRFVLS